MVTLTVAAHIENFVLDKASTATVQAPDVVVKFLPLGPICRDFIIGGVRAIDETKIYGGLMCVSVIDLPEQNGPYVVKSAWVRGWIVLQEKPSDGRIINIFIRIYSW